MKSIISAIALTLITSLAFSQTQLEMNEQAAKEYKISDKKLGKVYNELIKLLKPSKERDLLIKAQRNWINFRDAHAKYQESFYVGGSMQPIIYLGTLKELTDTRIKQLQDSLDELKAH